MLAKTLPHSYTTEQVEFRQNHESPDLYSTVISLNISQESSLQIQEQVILAARQRRSSTICFANVHMTVEAARDPQYAAIVNGADWVVADGAPISWAVQAIYKRKQERITGFHFTQSLLQKAAEEGLSVFFYGCTSAVLSATLIRCHDLYPSLVIAGVYSPPFRSLTSAEEEEVVERISNSGAHLVFVALGCPRQEVWIHRMRHRIPAVLLAIGGALPMLAGQLSPAPPLMQRSGLEWLYRLCQEPRRLFRRYMVTNTLFIVYLSRALFNRESPERSL